jgi:preprotein translocase subunit SecD
MTTKHQPLWKNWKILLWAFFLLGSFALIVNVQFDDGLKIGHNLSLGSEFSGGTLFQLQLAEPATSAQMSEIKFIVEKRLNPNGIKDVTVSNTGDQIVLAQVAETDSEEVKDLQSLLLKQGKFESFLNGQLVFDGSQIVQVIENAAQGYGAHPTGVGDEYTWTLPFLLNDKAAQDFSKAIFHQCEQIGFSAGQAQYSCAATYFFIDRPSNALVVYPSDVRSSDAGKLHTTADLQYPSDVTISDILENANLHLIETQDGTFTSEGLALLQNPPANVKNIILPASLSEELMSQIESSSSLPILVVPEDPSQVWIVNASGLRDVISLSPGITGNEPFIENIKDATIHPLLVITGSAPNAVEAKQRLDDLRILLKSGALPIPIVSINQQTVSADLGEQFLSSIWLMGILSFVIVEIIIFLRYRKWKLVGPLSVMGISEVIMILGFAALVKWNLDLASMAGILAAVGTGVDSEVIMTDEILQGEKEGEDKDEKGWAARAKRAFFIVAASASVAIAVMLPMVILGSGLGKLAGFALTTIAGVLLGVLISRPAFQEIIKDILRPSRVEETSVSN